MFATLFLLGLSSFQIEPSKQGIELKCVPAGHNFASGAIPPVYLFMRFGYLGVAYTGRRPKTLIAL